MVSTYRLPADEGNLHGTTWRTSRRSVEVSEPQPITGQLVEIRRPNLTAKTPQVAEPQVICYDDEEVGSLGFVGRLHVAVNLSRFVYFSFKLLASSRTVGVKWK